MEFLISEGYDGMSRSAADVVKSVIVDDPSCVLGLATGSTPIGMYACLVKDCKEGEVSFKDVTTFNLDEYVGLPGEHDQSYRYFMDTNLFDHVDIDKARTNLPDGCAGNLEQMCAEYEQKIQDAGGIDIQVLGIGHNGHIGFNEPCDDFPVATHPVDLTESTINANSRLFSDVSEVPRSAVTMGIGTIMKARKVIVLANGDGKADIVKAAFTGPVVPSVPASVLQLHPDVTIVLDSAAASKLDI
ncbi:MAG: glucosamine-6-phosphate deaminase [Eggerthellaceae bacterium]|nr:glucosamine-6-phosphate deaminase [Eggerthellaceae bacterium]